LLCLKATIISFRIFGGSQQQEEGTASKSVTFCFCLVC
jgi:hypothetical protein